MNFSTFYLGKFRNQFSRAFKRMGESKSPKGKDIFEFKANKIFINFEMF